MEIQVFLEHDAASGHFTATVAGFPEIVVDARSERTAVSRAKEAVRFALEEHAAAPHAAIEGRLVSVDV